MANEQRAALIDDLRDSLARLRAAAPDPGTTGELADLADNLLAAEWLPPARGTHHLSGRPPPHRRRGPLVPAQGALRRNRLPQLQAPALTRRQSENNNFPLHAYFSSARNKLYQENSVGREIERVRLYLARQGVVGLFLFTVQGQGGEVDAGRTEQRMGKSVTTEKR